MSRAPQISFIEFCQVEEFPQARSRKTGPHENASVAHIGPIRQIYRALGFPLDRSKIARRAREGNAPWELAPPPWKEIYEWRDRPEHGGIARLESHRKALVWLASYWGLNGPQIPAFLEGTWAHARAVRRAKSRNSQIQDPTRVNESWETLILGCGRAGLVGLFNRTSCLGLQP